MYIIKRCVAKFDVFVTVIILFSVIILFTLVKTPF